MRHILAHELKHYFKNKQELVYLYSYFISVIVIVPFALGGGTDKLQSLASVALWVALAGGLSLGAASLFRRDQEQGRLEYCQLLPVSLEALVAAKWCAFFLFFSIPLLASVPLAGLLYGLSAQQMVLQALGLVAGALSLSVVSVLIAALTNGLEKASAILSLIGLPLAIPVLIFGAQYGQESTSLWQSNLWFLLGYALFMFPVMCLAGACGIRASN